MAGPVSAPADGHQAATGGAFGIKGLAWAVFEWARNPYYNIIVIYVFTVYFANDVVGDSVEGQAIVADTIFIAGITMAILAPLLGVIVDRGGGKKIFIFLTLAILGACSFALGFIRPDLPGAIPIGMTLLVFGYCSYTLSEILHNALLPAAGEPKALPVVSGLGLFMGNIAGVVMLIGLFIIGQSAIPWIEGMGGVGPFSAFAVAIWLAVFIIPFFLFMPDHFGSSGSWKLAINDVFGSKPDESGNVPPLTTRLTTPVRFVREKFTEYPNVMRYLFARMIYADGIAVLLTIGAVYVSGVLEWTGTEVITFGIFGSLFGALGGFVGGALDRWLGPKLALITELCAICVILTVQVSVTKDAILFGLIPAGHDVWTGFGTGMFTSLADVFYVLMIIPAGIMIVACITSSRYMLVHVAPPQKIGEFFGFYAMAGNITVWIGPAVVSVMTRTFESQRIGMVSIASLFFIGLALLLTVRADKKPEHLKDNPRY